MPWEPKPVDCDVDIDAAKVAGKTAIVTGGANGLGEAYVRALVAAKVSVCFGDMNEEAGDKLAAELSGTKFVKCDVTDWEDQLRLFREAIALSPTGKVHYVVANAGIAVADDVFSFDDQPPKKPSLKVLDVNLSGVMYTAKLAFHYFIKQNGTQLSPEQGDTCLVLIGSGAAFLDCPRGPQYEATKFGVRGVMHSLRRTTHYYGSRVNVISPWYVRTKILPQDAFDNVASNGVDFASPEDGGQCLLRILSDPSVNGRMLFLSPRKWAKRGYMDLDLDDIKDEFLQQVQREQMASAPPEAGLFMAGKW